VGMPRYLRSLVSQGPHKRRYLAVACSYVGRRRHVEVLRVCAGAGPARRRMEEKDRDTEGKTCLIVKAKRRAGERRGNPSATLVRKISATLVKRRLIINYQDRQPIRPDNYPRGERRSTLHHLGVPRRKNTAKSCRTLAAADTRRSATEVAAGGGETIPVIPFFRDHSLLTQR